MDTLLIDNVADIQKINELSTNKTLIIIKHIHEEFSLPSNIECATLYLDNCKGITDLPEDLCTMKLVIQGASGITEFSSNKPYFPAYVDSLVIKDMSYIPHNLTTRNLTIIDSDIEVFDVFGNYKTLEFINCNKLNHIIPLNTEELNISNCESITNLDGIAVKYAVNISNAPNLENCDFLKNGTNMFYTNIHIANCPKITTLPGIATQNLNLYKTGITRHEMDKINEKSIIMNFVGQSRRGGYGEISKF